jgi:plastocyanin
MMRLRSVLIGLGTSSVLLLAACGNGPPPDQYSGSSTGTGGGGGTGGALQPASGQTAAAKVQETDQLKFVPPMVTAKTGDVVEWDNTSSVGHNVTFDQGTASPTMNNGDTYQVKFAQAGSYHYKCTFHPGMEGTVTVS